MGCKGNGEVNDNMMTYINSYDAFEKAIAEGRLNLSESAPNYAGDYMYMGTDGDGVDLFKHIISRAYDV